MGHLIGKTSRSTRSASSRSNNEKGGGRGDVYSRPVRRSSRHLTARPLRKANASAPAINAAGSKKCDSHAGRDGFRSCSHDLRGGYRLHEYCTHDGSTRSNARSKRHGAGRGRYRYRCSSRRWTSGRLGSFGSDVDVTSWTLIGRDFPRSAPEERRLQGPPLRHAEIRINPSGLLRRLTSSCLYDNIDP